MSWESRLPQSFDRLEIKGAVLDRRKECCQKYLHLEKNKSSPVVSHLNKQSLNRCKVRFRGKYFELCIPLGPKYPN